MLAFKRFETGNGRAFVQLAPRICGLNLVAANAVPLLRQGMYEDALLHAFTSCHENNFNVPVSNLTYLFSLANPHKLRKAGDPLPDSETFTIYRGVSGERRKRRVRSYSWTLDLDRACWFALRLTLPAPSVYSAAVPRAKILAYYNGRGEQEIVCRPDRCRRVSMTLDKMFDAFNRADWAAMSEEKFRSALKPAG
jgi:hypothetical protein